MISRAGTGEGIGTEDRLDAIFDCALEATFPVSDPVAFPLCGEPLVQDLRFMSAVREWAKQADLLPLAIVKLRSIHMRLVQVFRNFVEPRGNTASTERPFLSWHLP